MGPRYNIRYKTAAESALYNCYRSVMQIVKTRRIATVAFSILNSSRRGYPPEEGAHIALRQLYMTLALTSHDVTCSGVVCTV